MTETPCDPNEQGFGDFIDDTPFQDGPSSGGESCRRFLGGVRPLPDTCPGLPGVDVSCSRAGLPLHRASDPFPLSHTIAVVQYSRSLIT